jgi:hypothetical protein
VQGLRSDQHKESEGRATVTKKCAKTECEWNGHAMTGGCAMGCCPCDDCVEFVDQDTADLEQLRTIITRRMQRYPHGSPHPETVAMFAQGLLDAIDVSNARPKEYADEPWIVQSPGVHIGHARCHIAKAFMSRLEPLGTCKWLADDGTPELAHAVVRGMMGLWKYRKEQEK